MAQNVTPDIGLKNIPSVIRERQLIDDNHFPYSGLWLFSGQQGSGKTLLMMHCVKHIISQCPKVIIVSNINIYGVPTIPYTGLEDFDKYHNGQDGIIFIIDEIHTLFSSLESANMSVRMLTVWSQNRKNRRVILGTSQRFSRVAKGIREQTTWVYQCRRPILNMFYPYTVLDGADFDDDGKYSPDQPPRYSFYVPKVECMRMYNTLEVVKRDAFTNNEFDLAVSKARSDNEKAGLDDVCYY